MSNVLNEGHFSGLHKTCAAYTACNLKTAVCLLKIRLGLSVDVGLLCSSIAQVRGRLHKSRNVNHVCVC